MSGESVAQDQIKAFVERILRMKEERKAIDADIREIYAEAKGNGFDKTVLGKLVNYVEKRAADANAVMESESLFDLYLSAYDSASGRVGTVRATHTHEAKSQPTKAAGQDDEQEKSVSSAPRSAIGFEDSASDAGGASSTEQQDAPHPASDLTSPSQAPGQVAAVQESPRKAAEAEGESPALQGEATIASTGAGHAVEAEPATSGRTATENVIGVTAGVTGGESAATNSETGKPVEASASAAPLSFADKIKRLRPNCQHPQACRSSGGKAHCGPCGRAVEAGSAA